MREIIWRPRAVADVDGILAYIVLEYRSPSAAQSCADAILAAFERVAELPESGRLFIDDDLARPYRRVLAKNYWVYYSYDDETLTVWRVFHTSQDHDTYGFALLEE